MRAFHPSSGVSSAPASAPGRSERDPNATGAGSTVLQDGALPPYTPDSCSTPHLQMYLDGKSSSADESAIEAHVDSCGTCARTLNRLSNPQLRDLPPIPEFEIDAVIAQGGMGTIYRAYDPVLHRDVAIKMLKMGLADDKEMRERFVTAARFAGRLDHPNILPVHDLRRLPDGRPWLVMKLVRGHTLADLLEERQPGDNLDRFLDYFERACRAVAYAHAQGVIHRDLKPSNIMVEEVHSVTLEAHEEVFVMDWGLAKDMNSVRVNAPAKLPAPHASDQSSAPTDLTRLGLGTVPYMAPEQARGEPDLDERVDVFSLGAILCEILTGDTPYGDGGGQPSAFDKLLTYASHGDLGHAEYLLANCQADRELIDLAADCLREDRDRRPRNGGDVAKRIIAYRSRKRDESNFANLREVTQLVEASRKIESKTRADADDQRRTDELALAEIERKAEEERKARRAAEEQARRLRQRAAKLRRRITVFALIALLAVASLAALLGYSYWQYHQRTTRAVKRELREADQALFDARQATPDNALSFLREARKRIDAAKDLSVGGLTSEPAQADLKRLDEKCREDFAVAYNRLGISLMNRKNSKDAVDAFQKAVDYDRRFADAHANLAAALFQQKRYSDATGAFSNAFTLEPNQSAKTYSTAARAAAQVRADSSQDFSRQWLAEAVLRYRREADDPKLTTGQIRDVLTDLKQCVADEELSRFRNEDELQRLPPEDQIAWKALWADLDALAASLPR